MPTIAIISQKGGAGKTTLAIHLAAAAQDAGRVALVIDTDPQATASQWASWRQDVPPVYRINASLYLWRAAFVRREADGWREQGRHLLHEIPEARAIHIDDADEFARADVLIRAGVIRLPWLDGARETA